MTTTKIIGVYLDRDSLPMVQVDRHVQCRNFERIKWEKDDDSPDFDFVSVEPWRKEDDKKPMSLSKKEENEPDNKRRPGYKKYIAADNNTEIKGDQAYILTVTDGEAEYTTDGPTLPGDKPVIRN